MTLLEPFLNICPVEFRGISILSLMIFLFVGYLIKQLYGSLSRIKEDYRDRCKCLETKMKNVDKDLEKRASDLDRTIIKIDKSLAVMVERMANQSTDITEIKTWLEKFDK